MDLEDDLFALFDLLEHEDEFRIGGSVFQNGKFELGGFGAVLDDDKYGMTFSRVDDVFD